MNAVQPCAFCSSCVLSQIFVSNQPSTPAGPKDDHKTSFLSKIHVTRAEARVDRRRLLRLRIVHLELPAALRERERLGRRMIRSRLTPRQRLVLPDSRRGPDTGLAVHREAVRAGLAGPDRFLAPVRRRLRRRRVGRARGLRIANRQLHLAGGMARRVDGRHVVGALFERAVDRPVGVHGGIALVGRDFIVGIRLLDRPSPTS